MAAIPTVGLFPPPLESQQETYSFKISGFYSTAKPPDGYARRRVQFV